MDGATRQAEDAKMIAGQASTSTRPPSVEVTPLTGLSLPELLAPAGDWDCAKAAVENGADAIYFGLERFNARMRAQNFTLADLPRLMDFLHLRGVEGYVTFNTLVFADELADAEDYLRAIISAGVDAAIVQDIGICRLIRRLSPDFPIHASTQMSITSATGVEFARELGCQLVVLARECSLKEIERIQHSANADNIQLPLEVFVHGALCVAYSGQCLTSEALGGRSANRGECAQACRMPYTLVSDGQEVPLGDRAYLLSPQDLAGLEVLPDLIRAGVSSLKIEGRLKTPEYVANITRTYRYALDQVFLELTSGNQTETLTQSLHKDSRYDLEMAFSRGLYTGWFRGINNQQLVHGRFGKKRGVFLGEVLEATGSAVIIGLQGPLKAGDGVVFDSGRPEKVEQGGRVYDVRIIEHAGKISTARLTFGVGDIDLRLVHVGDKVWKTSDPALDRQLRQSFESEQPRFTRPLEMTVRGRAGQPLSVDVRDEQGHTCNTQSAIPLIEAIKHPFTSEGLRAQLGRLGGTTYHLAALVNELQGAVIIPLSELNRLRRDLVSQLDALRTKPRQWNLHAESPRLETAALETRATGSTHQPPELIVLVRTLPQLEAAWESQITTLYCEFEDPKKYRVAVERFRQWQSSRGGGDRSSLLVAPPRIFKMGEDWILKQVQSSAADGYLIRNYDHLQFFTNSQCVGDFSLNVANPWTAEYFMKRFGLKRLTASYDLNITQLEALARTAPTDWFEVTIHQHMPMFHMEHCVFCAFLSTGTDFTNCGRPCDHHEVKLRDRVGMEHPLKADFGCRNTLFNARAQTGAEGVQRLLALGLRKFRLEFLNESPAQVSEIIQKYRQLLNYEISGAQLWKDLKLLNQLGVTRGQLHTGR